MKITELKKELKKIKKELLESDDIRKKDEELSKIKQELVCWNILLFFIVTFKVIIKHCGLFTKKIKLIK